MSRDWHVDTPRYVRTYVTLIAIFAWSYHMCSHIIYVEDRYFKRQRLCTRKYIECFVCVWGYWVEVLCFESKMCAWYENRKLCKGEMKTKNTVVYFLKEQEIFKNVNEDYISFLLKRLSLQKILIFYYIY